VIACAFAIPGDFLSRTGGYLYDRHLLELLPRHGIDIKRLQLSARFPHPLAADLADTAALFERIPATTLLLVDGLAYGSLPASLIAAAKSKLVALIHHPLARETGLSERRREDLHESERRALARAHHIIVTSPMTGRILITDYGVTSTSVTVAIPGTTAGRRSSAASQTVADEINLLAVGSIIPRKGYDLLVGALAELRQMNWRLTIIGSTDLSPTTVSSLRQQIAHLELQRRIVLCGELDKARLEDVFDCAHVFVMPSLFEGYGMALTEAMACGLPIVTTTAGALAETAPDAVAIKVEPGSVSALADGLRRILRDSVLRSRLAAASWQAGKRLPDWHQTAATVAAVLRRVAA
jgi:glycosyltransferase involved in cell wall biosynthesis